VTGQEASIDCRACGMRSYHPEDIARRYCGNCHAFHDDLAAGRAEPGPIRLASNLFGIDWRIRRRWRRLVMRGR
jgi:hypothetical protein